jgi:phospholipid/cholesterol/gamma-HCH transport system substrate-binding protein
MKKINLELIVGLFLLAGFAAFAFISVQFGEFSVFSQGKNYSVKADFDEISGLKKGANVAMAGVNIGKVAQISLNDDNQAEIVMDIAKDVKITDDAIASIKTQGIIGDKYVKISQGGSDDYLNEDDFITETESAVDLEELISKYVFGDV